MTRPSGTSYPRRSHAAPGTRASNGAAGALTDWRNVLGPNANRRDPSPRQLAKIEELAELAGRPVREVKSEADAWELIGDLGLVAGRLS